MRSYISRRNDALAEANTDTDTDTYADISHHEIQYFGGKCLYKYVSLRTSGRMGCFQAWLLAETSQTEHSARVSRAFQQKYGNGLSIMSIMHNLFITLTPNQIVNIQLCMQDSFPTSNLSWDALFCTILDSSRNTEMEYITNVTRLRDRLNSRYNSHTPSGATGRIDPLSPHSSTYHLPSSTIHETPAQPMHRIELKCRPCNKTGTEECAICYEMFEVHHFKAFGCDHEFCEACVKNVLKYRVEAPTCPFCRKTVTCVVKYTNPKHKVKPLNPSNPVNPPKLEEPLSASPKVLVIGGKEVVVIDDDNDP